MAAWAVWVRMWLCAWLRVMWMCRGSAGPTWLVRAVLLVVAGN